MKNIFLYCYDPDEKMLKEINRLVRDSGFTARIISLHTPEELEKTQPESHYSVFLLFRRNEDSVLLSLIRKVRQKSPWVPSVIIGEPCTGDEVARWIRAGAGSYLEYSRLRNLPTVTSQLLLEDPLKDLSPDAMLAHYDFLLNISGNQLSMIDRNYTYLAINEAFCKAHHLLRNEVIGKTPEMIWGKKACREIIYPNLEKCFSSEKVHYRAWFDLKEQGKRFFEVTFFPHTGTNGKVDYLVVETRDITSDEAVKEDLRARNEDLQLLNHLSSMLNEGASAESIGNYICEQLINIYNSFTANLYFFDAQNNRLKPVRFMLEEEVVREIEKITGPEIRQIRSGYSGSSLLVQTLNAGKIRHINNTGRIKKIISELSPDNKSLLENLDRILEIFPIRGVLLVPLIRGDEKLGMLTLTHFKPFGKEEISRIKNISVQFTIILQTHREEEEKKEQTEKLRLLFDQAMDAIFLLENNRFIDCNPRTLDMFKVKRNEIIGCTPVVFSPRLQPGGEKSDELARQYIRKALAGEPQAFEWLHIRGDGSPFYALVNLNKMVIGEKKYLQAIVRDIDDLKKAFIELGNKEKALREAQEIALIGSWDLNLITGDHNWSEQVYKILEYSPETVQPSRAHLFTRVHPEDRNRIKNKIAESVNTGSNYEEYFRLKMPDGRIKYIHGKGKVEIYNNKPVRFKGTIQDISVLKKAEIEIRDHSAQLNIINRVNADINHGKSIRQIVRNMRQNLAKHYPISHIAIFTKDLIPNSFSLLAHSFTNSIRKKAVGVIGRTVRNFQVPENDSNSVAQYFYHPRLGVINEPEKIQRFFDDFLILLGANIPGRILNRILGIRSLMLYPVTEDKMMKYLVVITSKQTISGEIAEKLITLTEQLQVAIRKKLDEMEMYRLYTAIEQMDEIMFISTTEGSILYMNPAGHKITGIPVKNYLGKNTRDFRHPDVEPSRYEQIWKTVLAGETWQGELKLQSKDEKILFVHTIITPVKDEQGRVMNFVTLMRDVTREKEMQHFMQRSQKLEMIGRFAGGLAHDFNNILATMMGYSDMVRDELSGDNKAVEYLKKLKNSGIKARELIQQLLAFNRGIEPQKTRFSPLQIVQESLDLLKPQISKQIQIDVAGIDQDVMPEADPVQFKQVVLNLLTNAVYAVEKKKDGIIRITGNLVVAGPSSTVKGLGEEKGLFYCFAVADNGVGMEKNMLEQIFEPFFTTRPVGKGSGMGLSVVYGIIATHNGKIFVDSKPGNGTAFTVCLPYH
ncbi:MAG: PAS domain S-box protein [Chlorobi bacterium]|nr:PAS domain S-box protein [Chlorobiota bacterium]